MLQVTWYENDTDDPKNWPISKKWRVTLLVSLASFLSMFTSAMVAPAGTTIAAEFEIGQTTTIVIVSIFVLGFAIGPFYIAPMSEVYGRMAVLQSSMSLFLIFNVACAISTNEAQLIAFRFLSGIGGSAALVLGGGILTDIWSRETMGKASGIYHLAPLVGPPMGPLVSAFIVSATSWRWIFGAVSIACATFQVMALFFLPETYGPTILRRRMQRLKVQTGNPNLVLESDNNLLAALRISIVRPFLLLSTQPIVQVIALYMAYIFGLFYLLIASFPRVWIGQYGQSTSIAGLNYLSLGIGYIIGALSNARISDRILKKLTQKNGGRPKPEFRIPTMFVGSWLMPLGLFWYGFSANAKAHWIVPNLGMVVFSAGSVLCIEAMQTYIFDSYRRFAASALAAAIIARSIAGFAVPLASPALYDDLGIGWGTAVLAFIGTGIGIPAPFIFWFFGERLRMMSQYAAG